MQFPFFLLIHIQGVMFGPGLKVCWYGSFDISRISNYGVGGDNFVEVNMVFVLFKDAAYHSTGIVFKVIVAAVGVEFNFFWLL